MTSRFLEASGTLMVAAGTIGAARPGVGEGRLLRQSGT